jgi:hypothetical protein
MFKLKSPCVTCPFRKGVGELFQLHPGRLREIVAAPAFQCHKTVDYSDEDPQPGAKPQQCAGLMSLLHRTGQPNQIMQVGQRFGAFDPDQLQHADVYETMGHAILAHTEGPKTP